MVRRWGLAAVAVAVAAVSGTAAVGPDTTVQAATAIKVQGSVCLPGHGLGDLSRLFDGEPAGIVGADYQRATQLADGRVFWTFQDAAVRLGPDAITIVHNVGAIQDGNCFSFLYGGSRSSPKPYLFADQTVPYERWYWPLDAETGTDGRIYVWVAEMHEQGEEYLTHVLPVATRIVALNGTTAIPESTGNPPNPSASLYGWSVTSDADWTYLYAHCYRQFGFDPYIFTKAHDLSCTARITVARVPRGKFFEPLQYWDGSRWQGDAGRAAPIITQSGRRVNANQIEWTGASFVSVNKEGDWWGDTVYFSRAVRAQGPFEQFAQRQQPLKCATDCNTFFAAWVPPGAADRPANTLGWSIAHNRWDGVVTAVYRPSFQTIPAPKFLPGGVVYPIQIPDSVDGVPVLNVAAVAPADRGHVTVFPCDRGVPEASSLNYRGGETVANVVMVRPDGDGRVCVVSHATTDLIVDASGGLGDVFEPWDAPTRLVDTRRGLGGPKRRVAAGEVFEVQLPGSVVGVPVLNVTLVAPSGPGHATVFPCDREVPEASSVNYGSGETVANLVMVRPDGDRRVCVVSHAAADLVVDVNGVLDDGFVPWDVPTRLVDTRRGVGGPKGRVAAGTVFRVQLPDTVVGTPVLNVTLVAPSDRGHATVYPCDRPVPQASSVNYGPGETVANVVMVRPDADGRVCVVSHAATDLVIDVTGELVDGYDAVDNPTRITDTRRLP